MSLMKFCGVKCVSLNKMLLKSIVLGVGNYFVSDARMKFRKTIFSSNGVNMFVIVNIVRRVLLLLFEINGSMLLIVFICLDVFLIVCWFFCVFFVTSSINFVVASVKNVVLYLINLYLVYFCLCLNGLLKLNLN